MSRRRGILAALTARLRSLADQRGVTMLITLGALVITSALTIAVFTANNGDTANVNRNIYKKQAYYSAEAAINAYLYYLGQNNQYWTNCYQANQTAGTGAQPGVAVPNGNNPTAQSANEFYNWVQIPATGQTHCSATNAVASMIEGSGSFRVLFVGCAGSTGTLTAAAQCTTNAANTNQFAQVDIVVQFSTDSFLNYIYYTQYETAAPSAAPYEIQTGGPNNSTGCWQYETARNSVANANTDNCADIEFASGDVVEGPLYTDDYIETCGSPTLGRPGSSDPVFTQGNLGCPSGTNSKGQTTFSGSTPAYANPPQTPTGLQPPATNLSLASAATYTFNGATDITLKGTTFTAVNKQYPSGVTDPLNGSTVIWVQTNSTTGDGEGIGCPDAYTPYATKYDDVADSAGSQSAWYDSKDTGCGDAYVSGYYNASATIASDTDIVIKGNLCAASSSSSCPITPTGAALLGLIPNNFVRVYHPMNRAAVSSYNPAPCTASSGFGSPSNQTGTLTNPVIDAAILAVNDSFIVDNSDCGASLGTLNVYGAIAQRFRGIVAVPPAGYVKNYVYNSNLRYTEPPSFLAPAATVWTPSRSTLCTQSSTSSAACPTS